MKHITDIFFDLDHTLWDFEKNSALAFDKVLKKHKITVELEVFLKHYVPLNFKYWELYRHDKITQDQLRYGRLKDTFDILNYEKCDYILILSWNFLDDILLKRSISMESRFN